MSWNLQGRGGVVGSTMKPGDRGTRKLRREYGDRLVAVRYRYTESPPTRHTTVEIIVAQAPWTPAPSRLVLVEVKSWESDLRKRIEQAGGRFMPSNGLWRVRYDKALALGLKRRLFLIFPSRRPKKVTRSSDGNVGR